MPLEMILEINSGDWIDVCHPAPPISFFYHTSRTTWATPNRSREQKTKTALVERIINRMQPKYKIQKNKKNVKKKSPQL